MTISGCFIVKNDLAYCQSLLDSWLWLDEIVIVDNMSTDGTYEYLSTQFNGDIKLFQSDSQDFSVLRNVTLENSTKEYCIHLDMDMKCSSAFKLEVRNKLNDDLDVLKFSIVNHFLGEPLFYGPWSKWSKPWIHKRVLGVWEGKVHEQLCLPENSTTGKVETKIMHYGDVDFEERMLKSIEYSKKDFIKGVTKGTSYLDLIVKPTFTFFMDYFVRRNCLNGRVGLLLSLYTSTSLFYRLLFAWEKEKK